MLHRHRLIVTVTVVAAFSSNVPGDVLFVDDDNCPGPGSGMEGDPFCSIQTAIDAAADTDEILVAPGTYFETINFLGKSITLRSSDGPSATTIDGTGFFHVVQCVSGEGPDTVLEGFRIIGGDASRAPPVEFGGGGMFNHYSSPTVSDCWFSGNSGIIGGAMFNFHSSPMVSDCLFTENSVAACGGGMANNYGAPVLINCTFSQNTATVFHGGGLENIYSDTVITGCLFVGNTAGSRGGGMANNHCAPTVTGCVFDQNTSLQGSAMYVNDGSPTVLQCLFIGNIASDTGAGTIRNVASNTIVINCTFTGNSNGIYNHSGSQPSVTNSILWNNGSFQIAEFGGSAATVMYSNIDGGWPGIGNIDANPLFVDPANGDYRLSPGSPAIDAGHNWAIAGLADTDLDGNPRFAADENDFDPGCGLPVVVDMGVYEYQGDPFPVKLGDIDGDGIVGISDFLALLADWGACVEECCLADFDLDGFVGINDFLILLAGWG